MNTSRLITLAALSALLTIGTACAETLYSMTPKNCAIGRGGEGVVIIGHGHFFVTEGSYTREGELRDVGDGWTEADYTPVHEGVSGDPVAIRLKVEYGQVSILWPDGRELEAARCR